MTGADRRRRVGIPTVLAAFALVVAVIASGCAGVPVSSPVRLASPSPSQQQRGGVTVYPAGPLAGASALGVVDGFIESMASYQPNYQVARQFLTPSAQAAWATATVHVFDQLPTSALSVDGSDIVLTANEVAQIGVDGRWTSLLPGKVTTMRFPMDKVDGQWRISKPPTGVLMSKFDTNREFAAYDLAFFDPGFRWFVNERRFLPARGSLEAMLVSRLFAGPSTWLSPVVRTAVPEGEVASPTVTVSGDTARISIDDMRVSSLGNEERRLLYAQISETLAQVGISSVSIVVRQVPLSLDGLADGPIPVQTWSGFELGDQNVSGVRFAFVNNKVSVLGPGTAGGALVEQLHGQNGRSCAVSPTTDRLAVVDKAGRMVRLADAAGTKSSVILTGTSIAQPSFDPAGDLWLVDTTAKGTSAWIYREGKLVPVDIGSLARRHVTALRVSADGARAALVVRDATGSSLVIARLQRTGTESIPALGAPLTIKVGLDRIEGLAWSADDTLALLASRGGAPLQPYQVTTDGAAVDNVGSSPGARSLAAELGQPLLLGGTDGRIYSYEQGVRWQDLAPGASPCYPG
jgi:hypothetical protein